MTSSAMCRITHAPNGVMVDRPALPSRSTRTRSCALDARDGQHAEQLQVPEGAPDRRVDEAGVELELVRLDVVQVVRIEHHAPELVRDLVDLDRNRLSGHAEIGQRLGQLLVDHLGPEAPAVGVTAPVVGGRADFGQQGSSGAGRSPRADPPRATPPRGPGRTRRALGRSKKPAASAKRKGRSTPYSSVELRRRNTRSPVLFVDHVRGPEELDQLPGVGQGQVALVRQCPLLAHELDQAMRAAAGAQTLGPAPRGLPSAGTRRPRRGRRGAPGATTAAADRRPAAARRSAHVPRRSVR